MQSADSCYGITSISSDTLADSACDLGRREQASVPAVGFAAEGPPSDVAPAAVPPPDRHPPEPDAVDDMQTPSVTPSDQLHDPFSPASAGGQPEASPSRDPAACRPPPVSSAPITPSLPSPVLPASTSWPTPLSSSLCSLSDLSGPSSPGTLSHAGSSSGVGGGAARRRRGLRATTSYPASSASETSSAVEDELDQRLSNANLVLPTLPSMSALHPMGGAAPPPGRKLRLALVGTEEGGRGWLLAQVGQALGVAATQGWTRTAGGELQGRTRTISQEEVRVLVTLHSVTQASITELETTIRLLHAPLLQQLAPLVGGLPLPDLVDLARTGRGRGPEGWVDCVLVLLDTERTDDTLAAAAHLAYLAPTVLLALPSLTLPPLSPCNAPPFLSIVPGPTQPGEWPALALPDLAPLRTLLLGEGLARVHESAGDGLGRHLEALLGLEEGESAVSEGEAEGQVEGESDGLNSSVYSPSSLSSSHSDCLPTWPTCPAPFDPLFLPSTLRALFHPANSPAAAPWARGCLLLGIGAGLAVWGWVVGALGKGGGGWGALVGRWTAC